MRETYEKFENQLVDIRITDNIRTFNREDLKEFLMDNLDTDKKELRKIIRKKITRNSAISGIDREVKSRFITINSINVTQELRSIFNNIDDITQLIECKDSIFAQCDDIANLAKEIDYGNLSTFVEKKGWNLGDMFESISQDILTIDNIYEYGLTICQFEEYLKCLSKYSLYLSTIYNNDFYIPFIESEEEMVLEYKFIIENYNVKDDLMSIVTSGKSVKEFVDGRYSFENKQRDIFESRIKMNDYIIDTYEYLIKEINETLFEAQQSNLLSTYVKSNLSRIELDIKEIIRVYKSRQISMDRTLDQMKSVVKECSDIIKGFKAINKFEQEYLPKISEQSYSMLEDVNAYYNFSLKKNIERRKGMYGFSKNITINEVETMIKKIEESLYILTRDQREAIIKATDYLNYPYTTNCLLQGDVSSGKTIVSVALMFILAKKGFKSAYIVPRTTLRIQHMKTLIKYNELFGMELKIVDAQNTSDLSSADIILNGYSFNDRKFNDIIIDMAFIDEIQLLGVKQRNSIQDKYENIDMFYTTATPHPRTKMISLIGNMDVIEIRELPPGRKSKITESFDSSENLLIEKNAVIEEVFKKGEMMLVVCPLVNKQGNDISNVHQAFEVFKKQYPNKNVIKLISGEEKHSSVERPGMSLMDEKLQDCLEGNVDILVTTKIIEVGVDIPRASIIVIASSGGSFGYGVSSLHQLRGRVGRGSQQAYCYIQAPKECKPGSAIHTVLQTEDVFEITEKDLDWRGIEKIIGLEQSANGAKKNYKRLVEEYKTIAELVKEAVVNLPDAMFTALCGEIDTTKKVKDLN